MKQTRERRTTNNEQRNSALAKAPTGIQGLDELTGGGLPRGRPTLLCSSAGCDKTLLAIEFLVRGALESGEPGVFMAFEENIEDLATNFASLGHDLEALVAQKKLALEFVYIERSEIEETGEYDLEGLFVRLGLAIDSIGARRVVLDSVEALFSGLSNTGILRAELRRLFRWLKQKGVTTIITGELGESGLTRYGLEEYVADCVFLLDHRVDGQMATRRQRIVNYRGATHGTKLQLYVAQVLKSLAAFANRKRLCRKHLEGRYTIEVIDQVETHQLAKDDQILAICTPVRRIIGDLSNTERGLVAPDLIPAPKSST